MVDKLKYVIIEDENKKYIGISKLTTKHPAIVNHIRMEFGLDNMVPVKSAGFLSRDYDAFFDEGPTWYAAGYSRMLDIGCSTGDFDDIVACIGNPEEFYKKVDMDEELLIAYEREKV